MHENPRAFPLPDHYSHDGMPLTEGSQGMDLLDYFAAAALQGMIASEGAANGHYEPDWAAERSYNFATAMLAERARRKEAGA